MQSPNLKDRFIPKIQSDEDQIRKVKTKIETRNLASAPTGVDLDSFRGEMEQALRSDLQIQKTALSSLIQRIDVTQDGKVGVEFYINTRALGIIPRTRVIFCAGLNEILFTVEIYEYDQFEALCY